MKLRAGGTRQPAPFHHDRLRGRLRDLGDACDRRPGTSAATIYYWVNYGKETSAGLTVKPVTVSVKVALPPAGGREGGTWPG